MLNFRHLLFCFFFATLSGCHPRDFNRTSEPASSPDSSSPWGACTITCIDQVRNSVANVHILKPGQCNVHSWDQQVFERINIQGTVVRESCRFSFNPWPVYNSDSTSLCENARDITKIGEDIRFDGSFRLSEKHIQQMFEHDLDDLVKRDQFTRERSRDELRPVLHSNNVARQKQLESQQLGFLRPEEFLSLELYLGDKAYMHINSYLRHLATGTPIEPHPILTQELSRYIILGVSSMLGKLSAQKDYAFPLTVRRQVFDNDGFLDSYIPGQCVSNQGFTSTSESLFGVKSFGPNTMYIRAKTGASVAKFQKASLQHEREILFSPGLVTKILHREDSPDGSITLYMEECPCD